MNDNFKKINEILLAFNNIQSKGLRKFKECIPDEYNNKEYILHSINKLEDSLNSSKFFSVRIRIIPDSFSSSSLTVSVVKSVSDRVRIEFIDFSFVMEIMIGA